MLVWEAPGFREQQGLLGIWSHLLLFTELPSPAIFGVGVRGLLQYSSAAKGDDVGMVYIYELTKSLSKEFNFFPFEIKSSERCYYLFLWGSPELIAGILFSQETVYVDAH